MMGETLEFVGQRKLRSTLFAFDTGLSCWQTSERSSKLSMMIYVRYITLT